MSEYISNGDIIIYLIIHFLFTQDHRYGQKNPCPPPGHDKKKETLVPKDNAGNSEIKQGFFRNLMKLLIDAEVIFLYILEANK